MDNGTYSHMTPKNPCTGELKGDANNFYIDLDIGLKLIGTNDKYIYGYKVTDSFFFWDQEIEKRAG